MPVGDLSLVGVPENSLMDHTTPSNREEQTRRVAESLKRQLGPICPLLAAPDLVELMLKANGTLWLKPGRRPGR
jgi:Flp pilus assembly CpaF family ATPase